MSISSVNGAPLELTETALKLSKVIEREAKRRSALHNSNMARVQANMSSSRRISSGKTAPSNARSNHSLRSTRHSSVAVTPTPKDGPLTTDDRKATLAGPATALSRGPPALEREESRRRSEFVSQSEAISESDEPKGFRQTVWLLLDDPNSLPWAYYVSVTVFSFIVLSTATFIADTEPALDNFETEIGYIETMCAAVFTLELGMRVLFCPSKLAFFRSELSVLSYI